MAGILTIPGFLSSFCCCYSISYGKAPSDREVGNTLAMYTFQDTKRDTVSFYTFGSGEDSVTVDDLRVVKGRPSANCGGRLVEVSFKISQITDFFLHFW